MAETLTPGKVGLPKKLSPCLMQLGPQQGKRYAGDGLFPQAALSTLAETGMGGKRAFGEEEQPWHLRGSVWEAVLSTACSRMSQSESAKTNLGAGSTLTPVLPAVASNTPC